jgi:hypothetical protein
MVSRPRRHPRLKAGGVDLGQAQPGDVVEALSGGKPGGDAPQVPTVGTEGVGDPHGECRRGIRTRSRRLPLHLRPAWRCPPRAAPRLDRTPTRCTVKGPTALQAATMLTKGKTGMRRIRASVLGSYFPKSQGTLNIPNPYLPIYKEENMPTVIAADPVQFTFGPDKDSTRVDQELLKDYPNVNQVVLTLQSFDAEYTNDKQFGFGRIQVALKLVGPRSAQCTMTLRDDTENNREWQGSVDAMATFYGA